MNTIWTFGDSFTDYFRTPPDSKPHWRTYYIDWKGYVPKVYGEFLAEKLNMNLINKGMGGCDNSFIFEQFCKNCDKIKKDDIVIFGWTTPTRFRFPDKKNKWGFFYPPPINSKSKFGSSQIINMFEFLSDNTIQEILLTKFSTTLYHEELYNWTKLINFSLDGIKVIHWSWFQGLKNINILTAPIYENIKFETDGMVDDLHWSEKSHNEFSDFLINEINNFGKLKII